MRFLQTLLAFVTGAIAAVIWLDRQTAPERPRPESPPTPSSTPAPPSSPVPAPEPERVTERIVEEVVVPDPEQAARIEALEAELAEQRAIRTPEPTDPHPGVDAIRAARIRALELERQLAQERDDAPRWHQIEPPTADALLDAAAEHLPRVALWISPDGLDPHELWRTLGAMQEFAEASGGAWFEFDGDFARWCAESGHPHALDPDQPDTDDARPSFPVDPRVNRSGQIIVPTYVHLGQSKLYYIDDTAGQTTRIHIVGLG